MSALPEQEQRRKSRVAVAVTEYRHNSHAEVIVGRLLGQLGHDSQLDVVALYADQVPANDMSRDVSRVYGIPIYDSIGETIAAAAAGGTLDGVLLIAEHGDYPWNEKRQKLYPRRRFFEETFRAYDALGLSAPIFSDKHLAASAADCEWIYRQLKLRHIPFLGGSSIPLVPHVPAYDPERLRDVRDIVVVSWLGIESYGFHGMEVLQSLAEQRTGGECGVIAVQALEGRSVWAAMDKGDWPEELMLRALGALRSEQPGHPRDHVDVPVIFIVEYADGVKGYVLQLQRFIGEWSFAFRHQDGAVVAARCDSGLERPYMHFGELVKRIERLVITGRSSVPLERTYMTTQLIAAGMESLHTGRRMETPWLALPYNPIE